MQCLTHNISHSKAKEKYYEQPEQCCYQRAFPDLV